MKIASLILTLFMAMSAHASHRPLNQLSSQERHRARKISLHAQTRESLDRFVKEQAQARPEDTYTVTFQCPGKNSKLQKCELIQYQVLNSKR